MPPLALGGGGLVCEFVGKANMLSDNFDSKKSRESLDRYPYSSLITFEFRSREVRRLLIDLDHYGDTLRLGMFPLFLTRTTDVMAHMT